VRSRMQAPSYDRAAAANLTTAALVLALTCTIGRTAEAASAVPESYDGSPVMSRADLRAMRGGLAIAGMNIQFGATINTLVNGTLAAQTVLTLNDDGTMAQQTSVLNGAVLTPITGAQLASLTDGKIDPSALKGAQGFSVNDVPGLTAALSNITLQHADNVVINTTPGVDIQQLVNMQLTIQNFGQINSALHAAALAGRIARIGQVDPVLSGMH
jgi:hypothetical protein